MSGQVAQHWKLRMMAQGAALEEIANASIRRSLAFNRSFTCADVKIGDIVLSYKAQRQQDTPQWRGPAWVLHIDATGVPVKFQPQTFEVARLCVRKTGGKKDEEDAELDLLRERFRRIGADLGSHPRRVDVQEDMGVDREMGITPRIREHRRAILGQNQR